jgi:hypothetical protein
LTILTSTLIYQPFRRVGFDVFFLFLYVEILAVVTTSLCILCTILRSSRKVQQMPQEVPAHPDFKEEYGGVYIPTISQTVRVHERSPDRTEPEVLT